MSIIRQQRRKKRRRLKSQKRRSRRLRNGKLHEPPLLPPPPLPPRLSVWPTSSCRRRSRSGWKWKSSKRIWKSSAFSLMPRETAKRSSRQPTPLRRPRRLARRRQQLRRRRQRQLLEATAQAPRPTPMARLQTLRRQPPAAVMTPKMLLLPQAWIPLRPRNAWQRGRRRRRRKALPRLPPPLPPPRPRSALPRRVKRTRPTSIKCQRGDCHTVCLLPSCQLSADCTFVDIRSLITSGIQRTSLSCHAVVAVQAIWRCLLCK
mmetsp:Transcript_15464/g.46674  ORF Transcript_15464/g.46674 Transcript_15464/m.46674 type:complete len:261 (+) Transcript_15464:727-1509(+)